MIVAFCHKDGTFVPAMECNCDGSRSITFGILDSFSSSVEIICKPRPRRMKSKALGSRLFSGEHIDTRNARLR